MLTTTYTQNQTKSNESNHCAIEEIYLPNALDIDIKEEPLDDDFQSIENGGIFSDFSDSYGNIKIEDIDIKCEGLENHDEIFDNTRTGMIRTYSNNKIKKQVSFNFVQKTDDDLLETKKVIPLKSYRIILEMKVIDERLKVFASTAIPKGLKFGPVFSNVNKSSSDWLHSINVPYLVKDTNIVGFKEQNSIYYQTSREINKGEELTVHFADEFVESLGLDSKKFYSLICTPCNLAFLSKLYFMKHKMKCRYTPKNGITRCPYCEVLLHEPKYLEDHMKRCAKMHQKKLDPQNTVELTEGGFSILRNFTCSHCEYQSENYAASKKHALSHYIVATFKCNVCNNEFESRDTLRKHKKIHRKDTFYNCTYCTYKAIRKNRLSNHIKSRHTNDKKYQCSSCPLRFVEKGQLSSHVKVHKGLREFLCEVCSKSFTRMDNLRVHMNIHLDLRFMCSKCNYQSHYKAILKEHMKKKHGLDNSVIEEHIKDLFKKTEADKT